MENNTPSFSDIIQKNIDKYNKKINKSRELMKQAIERAEQRGTREKGLKDNQINIMDLI
jgi:flagellar hook-basal body complex protein FliE